MFRVSVDFREGALLLAMFKFQGDEKAPCRKQATYFTFLWKACQMHKWFPLHITAVGILTPTTDICINRTRRQGFSA